MKQPVHGSYEPATTKQSHSQHLSSLYVALELLEHDAGYSRVAEATESLGERVPITPSLWHLTTPYNLDDVFKEINASMLDRRIDSYSSLFILDPLTGHAKWHLRQPLSDLIHAHWDYQNNIFISFFLGSASQNVSYLFITLLGLASGLH